MHLGGPPPVHMVPPPERRCPSGQLLEDVPLPPLASFGHTSAGGTEGIGREAQRARAARQHPVWIADEEASACMLCDVEFSLLERRTHCRYCGWVVCQSCANVPPVDVDRWVSSTASHPYKQCSMGGTKLKSVCRSCHKFAPAEVAARLRQVGVIQEQQAPGPDEIRGWVTVCEMDTAPGGTFTRGRPALAAGGRVHLSLHNGRLVVGGHLDTQQPPLDRDEPDAVFAHFGLERLQVREFTERGTSSFLLDLLGGGADLSADLTSARLTSVSKKDGQIHLGPVDEDGWRRGLFEIGLVSIWLRNNRNPVGVLPHTLEFATARLSGKYEFSDTCGCTHTVSISRPGVYTVDFGLKFGHLDRGNLAIVKVQLLRSTGTDTLTVDCGSAGSVRRWMETLGKAGASVPPALAEQIYIEEQQRAAEAMDEGGGGVTMGWLWQKAAKGWEKLWFELRGSQLSCHTGPGTVALGQICVDDSTQLWVGPNVESELGMPFSWRVTEAAGGRSRQQQQPQNGDPQGQRGTQDGGASSDSDDSDGFDLIDVDEAPQLSRNTKGKLVVSVPAMTLWSGVRAASEVDYSRWVKALHGGGRAATSAGGEVLLSCCTLWRQLASVDPAALETLLE